MRGGYSCSVMLPKWLCSGSLIGWFSSPPEKGLILNLHRRRCYRERPCATGSAAETAPWQAMAGHQYKAGKRRPASPGFHNAGDAVQRLPNMCYHSWKASSQVYTVARAVLDRLDLVDTAARGTTIQRALYPFS